MSQGSLKVYCDNDLAVKRFKPTAVCIHQSTQHADVVHIIRCSNSLLIKSTIFIEKNNEQCNSLFETNVYGNDNQ